LVAHYVDRCAARGFHVIARNRIGYVDHEAGADEQHRERHHGKPLGNRGLQARIESTIPQTLVTVQANSGRKYVVHE
jgi:hypothetical protein